MAEKVNVNRLPRLAPDGFEFGPHLIRGQHSARKRPEPAGLGDGDHHSGIHSAGHGGLNDRELDIKEGLDAMVGRDRH